MSLRLAPRRTPTLLQSETSECGLVCLAMVAGRYGLQVDLPGLRRNLPMSGRGASIESLLRSADQLGLQGRAVRLELDELPALSLPAVLHWQFDHFVVLSRIRFGRYEVLDPASGKRWVRRREIDGAFTGVALELTPGSRFQPRDARARVRLADLLRSGSGLARALTSVLALSVLIQIAALLAPQYLQWTVDEALVRHDDSLLGVLAFAFAALLLIRVGFESARSLLVLRAGSQLALHLSTRLFDHLLKLPLAWFERRSLGDVVSRFGSLGPVRTLITESGVLAVLDAVMACATGVMMWIYSPPLALLVVAVVVVYTAIRFAVFPVVRRRSHEQLAAHAREETHVLETLRAMAPVKVFGLAGERAEGWRGRCIDALNQDIGLARIGIAMTAVRGALFGLMSVAVIYVAAQEVLAAGMTVGMVFAFVSYSGQFSDRFGGLVERVLEWRGVQVHLERLADIALEEAEQEVTNPDLLEHSPGAEPVQGSLELCAAGLRYGDEAWVFRGIDLKLEPGEFVALLGESGVGKTSLIKVLLGLLPPTEGRLRFAGVDVTQSLSQLRGRVVAVLQDDVLLGGSLADNIAAFQAPCDLARVQAAAIAAHIHQDIVRLPMGYRTEVGDLGAKLSGGQRQRVLLARALYQRPSVLVLDEGTAHLDPAATESVLDVLAQLPITRLLITHDPAVAVRATRVLRLERDGLSEAQQLSIEAGEIDDADSV